MTEWKDIASAPRDGSFRFYGLHCMNNNGFRWFEAHYVALDDEGQLIEPSGDHFSTWSYEDFELYADAPAPPTDESEVMPDDRPRAGGPVVAQPRPAQSPAGAVTEEMVAWSAKAAHGAAMRWWPTEDIPCPCPGSGVLWTEIARAALEAARGAGRDN